MNKVPFIVLSGVAGAGKDAVAKILVEQYGWELYSLAAPLKRFAADMYGFTDEQLYGPSSARNAPDPRWARPCESCEATGSNWIEDPKLGAVKVENGCPCCEGTGKINDNSPRRVLQLLGEEYLRQMIHRDALTMRARHELESLLWSISQQGHGGIVVNDARNDNDRDNLHEWLGAHRVDVRTARVRSHKPNEAWRQHASEQRLAQDLHVEHILNNDESWPFPSLGAHVDAMLMKLLGRAPTKAPELLDGAPAEVKNIRKTRAAR